MVEKKLWFITPTNEGQELNYHEDFEGSLQQAKARGQMIANRLQIILKDGQIGASIENKDGKEVKYLIARRNKLREMM